MKRNLVLIFFIFICVSIFAQKKLGTINNENILELNKCNNDLIYTYVEEQEGLISILQDFYCVINGKKYGPYSKQPEIIKSKKHYYIEVRKDDTFGYIINNTLFGLYEDLDEIIFNNDESLYCFRYRNNNSDFLIENGKIVAKKPNIVEPTFGPDNYLYYGFSDEVNEDYPEIYVKDKNNITGPYSDIDEFTFNYKNEYCIKVEVEDYDDYYLYNGKLYEEDDFKRIKDELGFSDYRKDDNGFYYQEGNRRTPSYEKIEPALLFNYSDILVFKGIKDDKVYIIKDFENIYGPYPKDKVSYVILSPGNNYLFYGVQENGEYHLYKDGIFIEASTDLIYPFCSDNDKTFCYIIKSKNNKEWLSTGKEKVGPYDSITDITVSADGSKIAYVVKEGNNRYVYEGTKKYGPYSFVFNVKFSKNNSLLYIYEDNDFNCFINFKVKTYGPFHNISFWKTHIEISDDDKHIAAIMPTSNSAFKSIFLDGKIIGEIDNNSTYWVIFSKDNNQTLCYSWDADSFYLDSKKVPGKISVAWEDYFSDFGIIYYLLDENNKKIKHLIIDGKDYKGQPIENGFIYLDGKNIMYITR